MKPEHLTDIIFGGILLPGMMLFFPLGEWLQWHPSYVLVFVLWLYLVLLLCRKVLGPMMLRGWRGKVTVAGILFIVVSVNFLMTFTPVDFPKDPSQVGKMDLHMRAMWVLLLSVIAYGIPVGMLVRQVKDLSAEKEVDEAVNEALEALETKRAEAVGGEEILLKSGYKTIHVPLSAVRYIEGRNNYACVHLDHRDDVVSQITLKDLMELLPEGKFVRIHRSYIVPVWRIEKQTASQVTLMGIPEPLPVGRAFKDQLKKDE